MAVSILLVVLSLFIILFFCSVFVNAIEQLGAKLNLHQGIIGSILAAVGTAMPETLIPIIAIIFTKGEKAHEIGVGAIAGAPFMLGTLAFFVTGTAVCVYAALGKRPFKMNADPGLVKKDLSFFMVIYGIAVLTTFIHNHYLIRTTIAVVLMLSYAIYVKVTVSSGMALNEDVEELYLSRYLKLKDSLFWVCVQLIIGLIFIILGAHLFVKYVEDLSISLGISALVLSIIITPIATELPEKFNSVIWTGKHKDTLALGNITGAMVFQSSFPVVFGIIFTEWNLRGITLFSAIMAFVSSAIVLGWVTLKKSLNPIVLMMGGIFYVAFLIYTFC